MLVRLLTRFYLLLLVAVCASLPIAAHAQEGNDGGKKQPLAVSGDDEDTEQDVGDGEKRPKISPAQNLVEEQFEDLIDIKSTDPESKTCWVRNEHKKAVVAKVMCELRKGDIDKRMVKLPTGQLHFVDREDTRPTDKPFKPAMHADMIRELKQQGFGDYTFVPDGYYLYAYKCSEGFYVHSRSILSTMMVGVVKQLREWGLEVNRPETPLVVIMFPSREEFDDYKEMPPGVAAYYSGVSNWVYLYEDTDLWDSAPEFAMKQYAYTVAHEGIHQVLHNTGIQQRLSKWPSWASEGVPEYFCPLNVSSTIVKQGKDKMPKRVLKYQKPGKVNDMRMWEMTLGAPNQGGRLVRGVVSAPRLTSYGYAISWGVVHYLASRQPKEFAAYLQDLSELKPLQANWKITKLEADPLFVKHFGDDFGKVERLAERHLKSKKIQREYKDPIENQTYYVIKYTYKQGGVFHTRAALTRSPVQAKEFRDEKEAEIEQMGEKAAFYTIVCKNADEARYHILKLMR